MTPSDIKADLCNEHGVLQLRMTKFHDDRVALYVPCVGTFDVYLGTDADLHTAADADGVSRMFRNDQEAKSMASMFAKRMRRHAIKVEVIDAEA